MAKKEHIERDAFRKLLIDRQITDVFFNNAKREEIGCVVDMLDRYQPPMWLRLCGARIAFIEIQKTENANIT